MTITITIGAVRTPIGVLFGVHLHNGNAWIGVYATVSRARLERDLLVREAKRC